jgi:hypothetical protein
VQGVGDQRETARQDTADHLGDGQDQIREYRDADTLITFLRIYSVVV